MIVPISSISVKVSSISVKGFFDGEVYEIAPNALTATPMEWFHGFFMDPLGQFFGRSPHYVLLWVKVPREEGRIDTNDIIMCSDAYNACYSNTNNNTDIVVDNVDDIFRICQILTEEGVVFHRDEFSPTQWRVYNTPMDEMEYCLNDIRRFDKIRYGVYVSFPKEDRYITMAQCHECDELVHTGMIEQVTGDLIDWHDIATIDEVKIALGWIKSNLHNYTSIEVCEVVYDIEGDYVTERKIDIN